MAYDLAKIHEACVAAGLPVATVRSGNPPTIVWEGTPTAQQIAAAEAIINDPLLQIRRLRTLYAIYQSLNSLTAGQKTAVWADLSAGTPPKYFTSTGSNDASILVLYWAITFMGLTGNPLLAARISMTAMYVQDNPGYLRNPPFDPTINVSGDEHAPEE